MRAQVLALWASLALNSVEAFGKLGNRARQHIARHESAAHTSAHFAARDVVNSTSRFLNNATQAYKVDSLPDVPFPVGELYSGLVPITYKNLSEQLFFVFQPTIGEPVDEITIWLNGGPGCSSLEGFFQESGLWLWQPGTLEPVYNPYSWVNLTNMLWVEQPIGTGFSIGTPSATSEEEIAQNFADFFKNFEKLFGISNFKIYITGESYAGRYVPYISAAMLDRNDTKYFDLSGAMMFDPVIGSFTVVQEEIPIVPFVEANANLFGFNESFMVELSSLHESCGYKDYIDKFLTFPPTGLQPTEFLNYSNPTSCDIWDLVDSVVLGVNPCFDIYSITATCPLLWDVLQFPTQLSYAAAGAGQIYFNRTDVKNAMHAPQYIDWSECSAEPVFVGVGAEGPGWSGPEQEGDSSADPIQHVLPQVIEATNRVIVSNGDYDMIILTNGTLLAIQNMTWNGLLGFQTAPEDFINIELPDLMYADVFEENGEAGVDGPQGIMGISHFERGLMWAETFQSGHMQPEFQPRVTYKYLQWLLGRIESL